MNTSVVSSGFAFTIFQRQPKREHRGGVASWRRQTILDLFRHGEVVPKGRTNEEEVKLLTARRRE